MKAANAYAATAASELDDLLRRHAPLIRRIAHHLAARLPATVQIADLIQAGMLGLMDAARHYDTGRGASFETYAGIRVRGAMLDEVRRNDWTPRSVHRRTRELTEAMARAENMLGREATDTEIAREMNLPLEDYHALLRDVRGHRVLSLETLLEEDETVSRAWADSDADPAHAVEHEQARQQLAGLIAALPERERLVLALYYDDELNLAEIGRVLGVTESRVCQIHSQALLRLRARAGMARGVR
jgi:RNA polymerase sigma factor for flagellar operon FliA